MTTDLPPGWRVATLDECCMAVEKVDPRKSPRTSFDYIDIGGISSGSGRIEVAKRLRGSDAPSRARQRVRAGDIVLSTVRTYQRKTAIVPESLDGAIASTGFCVLRPRRAVNSRFMLHQLLGHGFVKLLSEKQTGTSYPAVRDRDVRAMSIRLAPEIEQARIVAAIDELFSRLDAAASSARAAVVKADVSRQSILVEALSGRLSTQNQEEEPASKLLDRIAGSSSRSNGSPSADALRNHERASASLWELPRGWTWAQLQDLTAAEPRAITDGPFGSNLKTAHYTTAGPRVIRLQNIGDGEFKREDAHISSEHFESLLAHSVQPDDLIVASLGQSLPRACLVPHWVPPAIVKADCIRVRLHPEVNPSYVNLALQDPRLRRETAADIKGVGRPRLGLRGIRKLLVPLAPRAEQDRIVEAIEAQFARLDTASGVISAVTLKFEAMRRAVLTKGFAGQLVPRGPGGESAPQPHGFIPAN